MKNGFFLPPEKLNLGYVISAAGFLLYLLLSALAGQRISGIVSLPFAVFSAWLFLSVSAARSDDKETYGYNILWGSCALMILHGACAVLSIRLCLGL